MSSSAKSTKNLLSDIDSIFDREFQNPSEAYKAYNALWNINRSLFPDNKASRSANSTIGTWDESDLSERFKSDLETLESTMSQLKPNVQRSDRWRTRLISTVLSKGLIQMDKKVRKENGKNAKLWKEICKDPRVQRTLSECESEGRKTKDAYSDYDSHEDSGYHTERRTSRSDSGSEGWYSDDSW
ncbi:hypothetical protein I203_106940 [Kwoniella mangroviensis CBS 8507]|uniref:hypothetical protein n=1 Tax=Kwoniella mangroviensis CBS 8507 TaxID=1296122 RepID=UPI00080D2FCD|nr:uncharacterized protein I203_08373 [Kwoniella mangroviensis CBS 8507]OCF62572.1 hypothetical protein I203_08373 [Kwoniella mangroviensis CBS 8507]